MSAECVKPDTQKSFKSWVKSIFIFPFACRFEYLGAENSTVTAREIINPQTSAKLQAIEQIESNGMRTYLVRSTETLYAYYETPNRNVLNRKLPAMATEFLKADTVLVVDVSHKNLPMQRISYRDFVKEMERLNIFSEGHAPPPAATPDASAFSRNGSRPSKRHAPEAVAALAA
jgi:hypothetical protein